MIISSEVETNTKEMVIFEPGGRSYSKDFLKLNIGVLSQPSPLLCDALRSRQGPLECTPSAAKFLVRKSMMSDTPGHTID